jgi:hypothetical protein
MKALSFTEECQQKGWHTIQQIAYTNLIPLQWLHKFKEERKIVTTKTVRRQTK